MNSEMSNETSVQTEKDNVELLTLISDEHVPSEPQTSVEAMSEDTQIPTVNRTLFEEYTEIDLEIPVKKETHPYKTIMTADEFDELFKKITYLPNLSQLSLNETPEHSIGTHDYTASEEQLEEISDVDSSSEYSTESGSEDSELLTLMQKIDEQNEELWQEVEIATAPMEAEKEVIAFMDIAGKHFRDPNSQLMEDIQNEENLEKTKIIILDFLGHLIDRVVNTVNLEDPNAILRERLDKKKLLNKLLELIIQLHQEQDINELLNKKMVNHFRHKKLYAYITQTFEEISAVELEKMRNKMDRLDVLLGYQKSLLENKTKREEDVKSKINKLLLGVSNEKDRFDELVRSTLAPPESSERHITVINALLSKLTKVRHEVSECRQDLIIKQSQIAQIKMELKKCEYIGKDLPLNDYNSLLTETTGLSKLVEEKNYKVQVYKKRYFETVHTVTHMRENMSMEENLVDIQEEILKDVEEEKRTLRGQLHHLKLKHLKILQERSKIIRNGGLLGKPATMLNYDKVIVQIPQVRKSIKNLKEVYQNLTNKIANLEKS